MASSSSQPRTRPRKPIPPWARKQHPPPKVYPHLEKANMSSTAPPRPENLKQPSIDGPFHPVWRGDMVGITRYPGEARRSVRAVNNGSPFVECEQWNGALEIYSNAVWAGRAKVLPDVNTGKYAIAFFVPDSDDGQDVEEDSEDEREWIELPSEAPYSSEVDDENEDEDIVEQPEVIDVDDDDEDEGDAVGAALIDVDDDDRSDGDEGDEVADKNEGGVVAEVVEDEGDVVGDPENNVFQDDDETLPVLTRAMARRKALLYSRAAQNSKTAAQDDLAPVPLSPEYEFPIVWKPSSSTPVTKPASPSTVSPSPPVSPSLPETKRRREEDSPVASSSRGTPTKRQRGWRSWNGYAGDGWGSPGEDFWGERFGEDGWGVRANGDASGGTQNAGHDSSLAILTPQELQEWFNADNL